MRRWGVPLRDSRRRPTRAEVRHRPVLEEGLDAFYAYGGRADDPWGERVCDDGSCEWCQGMEREYRWEAVLAGELFEVLTPPITQRIPLTA